MGVVVREQGRTEGVVLPPRPPVQGALAVDDGLLLELATALSVAEDAVDVADAALHVLAALPGVRATLVARSARAGTDPVVLASTGYDCGTMAPGAVLPLDAGLPVTETVRTGRVRTVGGGPSWVAVPAGPGAALLLSLRCPPPDDAGSARLERAGRLLAGALGRGERTGAARTDLTLLEEGLAPAPPQDAARLVVRSQPHRPPLSGDVVEAVADGPVRWVLVADVCGSGVAAAVAADRLRAAFLACAPGAGSPAAVLSRLDLVLPSSEEQFATALVLRVEPGLARIASAGHPAPLLVPGGRLPLVAGEPLWLHLVGRWPGACETSVDLVPGDRLLLATDGLVDRGGEVDLDALVAALPPGLDDEELADAVLRRCAVAGPAQDDATVVVLTV